MSIRTTMLGSVVLPESHPRADELLYTYISSCFHHIDAATAVSNVLQLFRRAIGAHS